jgi:hypothetical protein
MPSGTTANILYSVDWYRDTPSIMRMGADGIPFSPRLNCSALGAREKKRRSNLAGFVDLHCANQEGEVAYTIRHIRSPANTIIWWYSPGYLDRDRSTREEVDREWQASLARDNLS